MAVADENGLAVPARRIESMIRPGGGMRAPRSHCVFVAIDSHSDCWGTLVVGGDNRIAVSHSLFRSSPHTPHHIRICQR